MGYMKVKDPKTGRYVPLVGPDPKDYIEQRGLDFAAKDIAITGNASYDNWLYDFNIDMDGKGFYANGGEVSMANGRIINPQDPPDTAAGEDYVGDRNYNDLRLGNYSICAYTTPGTAANGWTNPYSFSSITWNTDSYFTYNLSGYIYLPVAGVYHVTIDGGWNSAAGTWRILGIDTNNCLYTPADNREAIAGSTVDVWMSCSFLIRTNTGGGSAWVRQKGYQDSGAGLFWNGGHLVVTKLSPANINGWS